jgi:uncharacterized membrane protein YbhN (UPF0104 family)
VSSERGASGEELTVRWPLRSRVESVAGWVSRYLPVLRVVAFVVALGIVVVMAVRAFRDVDLSKVDPWLLVAAVAAAMVWWVLLARGWALLVEGIAQRKDVGIWCRTQAIRYLPGGIWAPASRATLISGTVFDRISTVGAENVLALCAAVAVGAVGFALGGQPLWLPLALALALPVLAAPLVEPRSRLTRGRLLLVTANDTVAFVAYVVSAVLVQGALSGWGSAFAVAGAAGVAWGVGLVVVIAPSGIGVREVLYVSLLAGTVPHSEATAAAITLRLVTVLAELVVLVLLGRPSPSVEAAGATRP